MYEHCRDAERILTAACKTSGYSVEYFVNQLTDYSTSFKDFQTIDLGVWCFACSILKIDVGCFAYGYSSVRHKQNIAEAILSCKYTLTMTDEVQEIWKLYQDERYKIIMPFKSCDQSQI